MGKRHTKAAAGAVRANTLVTVCAPALLQRVCVYVRPHIDISFGLGQLQDLCTSDALSTGLSKFRACSAACAVLQS